MRSNLQAVAFVSYGGARLVRLMGRRPVKVAAVALATAWTMAVRGERFNGPKLSSAA
jgi:hypothetical protein